MTIRAGMALAAGLGTRMRPLTDTCPKPLLQVGGRSMLDRALDRFRAQDLSKMVVNIHYKAEMIRGHLADQADIAFSDESDALLETGGGVAKALALLGEAAFFVSNTDTILIDGPVPALARMAQAFDAGRMDALLLLHPTESAQGYDGKGDFFLENGRPVRRGAAASAPFVFTGTQILHPRLFAGAPQGAFSLNVLYDRALAAGRLYALAHDGQWFHVGTPDALAVTDQLLSA